MGFLIPPGFPQDFTVAPRFPSTLHREFLINFLKTPRARGPNFLFTPLPHPQKQPSEGGALFSLTCPMSYVSSTASVQLPIPGLWGAQVSWRRLRLSPPASSLPIFISPVTTPPWMVYSLSFLHYLIPASPSPRADRRRGDEKQRGRQGREEARKGSADRRRTAPAVLPCFWGF